MSSSKNKPRDLFAEFYGMHVLFGREEFESEYQDKLAEYEAELKEWKKEAKRRVTV